MISSATALQGYYLYAPVTAEIPSLVIILDGLPDFPSISTIFAFL
jgi:hypothetical protein